jgi:LPS export ABC transporter protein LptC
MTVRKFSNRYIPAIAFIAGIFFSCVNDLDKVKRISASPDSPDETSEFFHVIFTDSGLAQIEINARIAETYSSPRKVTKFKDGLKVNFFNNLGEVASTLTSIYGEIDDETGDITVRDSVVFVNIEEQKTLETEVLYWIKGGDSIFTDKEVTIKSPDMILYGIGAWTTPLFDTAQFYKPKAEVYLKN